MMVERKPPCGLGERVKYLREKRGYSIEDVCNQTNCPPQIWNQVEAGQAEQGGTYVSHICKFAEEFGVSVEFLFYGREWTNQRALFDQDLRDAEEKVLQIAVSFAPNLTVAQVCVLLGWVRSLFDRFIADRAKPAIAWRRENDFVIDEFDVRKEIRKIQSRSK